MPAKSGEREGGAPTFQLNYFLHRHFSPGVPLFPSPSSSPTDRPSSNQSQVLFHPLSQASLPPLPHSPLEAPTAGSPVTFGVFGGGGPSCPTGMFFYKCFLLKTVENRVWVSLLVERWTHKRKVLGLNPGSYP